MKRTGIILILVMLLVACSTTRHLPQGEVLYIGQRKMIINQQSKTKKGQLCMTEIESALAKAPNNSFFGSSYMRTPFPIGLWIYGGFAQYQDKNGLGHWIFEHFGTSPVLLSTVNPLVRSKIASNLLHDYGYFHGSATSQTFFSKKDSMMAKVQYTLNMGTPSYIDTIYYNHFSKPMLDILERGRHRTLLSEGTQFNVPDLDSERTRITNLMRNRGYYYYRSNYLIYQADTLLNPGKISLKLQPVQGVPIAANRPYYLGSTSFYLMGKNGEVPDKYISYKDLDIYYYQHLKLRPHMLYRWLNYQAYTKNPSLQQLQKSRLYNEHRQTTIQDRLGNLGLFRSVEIEYMPRDTAQLSDTLDVLVRGILNKPLEAELQCNVTTKSNDQTGPGVSLLLDQYNVFGGGEIWTTKLKGSYEWQTANESGSSLLNSWEYGLSSALSFPRVLFPTFGKREYDYAANTTFNVSINQLNRAKYYKLLSFGGDVSYNFQPSSYIKHSITPFRLTFNVLQHTTAAFDSISSVNPALYISLQNKFIPAMDYTFTYDNSSSRKVNNYSWLQVTMSSGGNITSLFYRAFGRSFSEKNKDLFGIPFAQFLKLNAEYRYNWKIDKNQSLVSRIAGGIIYSYGNSTVAPYSEQFYVGGANSIRAFTVRSIGPGGFHEDDARSKYSYVEQTGDLKFEANTEYRFRIIGDIHGAFFLDAGNVWLIRNDSYRPDAQFRLNTFAKQIALGTGFGIRYDIDYLVFRLDAGIALHDPYNTERSGYYNISSFRKGIGIHFAIGYPF